MGQSSHLGKNAGCTAPMKPYKMVFRVFIFPGVGAESRLTPPSRCHGVQVGSGSDPHLAQSCIEYICNKYTHTHTHKRVRLSFNPLSSASVSIIHQISIQEGILPNPSILPCCWCKWSTPEVLDAEGMASSEVLIRGNFPQGWLNSIIPNWLLKDCSSYNGNKKSKSSAYIRSIEYTFLEKAQEEGRIKIKTKSRRNNIKILKRKAFLAKSILFTHTHTHTFFH